MPFESPRLRGIREHLERVRFFLEFAEDERDKKSHHRIILAAIYSCRAISELMLEAAEKQEVKSLQSKDIKKNRKDLESDLAPRIPYYDLIERIRIHDFHRFGIVPPDPSIQQMMFGGPVKLSAQRGAAVVAFTDQGPQEVVSGNSKVEYQRPLLTTDGECFDEASSAYVKIENIVKSFLAKAPDVISYFEELCA